MRVGRSGLFAVAISLMVVTPIASAADGLPTVYKAAILYALLEKYPGRDLVNITSTTDIDEIVSACGRLSEPGETFPFYVMVFPGDPPRVISVFGGVNATLAGQVRSLCTDAGLSVD